MRKRAWIGLAGAALLAGGLPAVFGISPAGAGTVQGLNFDLVAETLVGLIDEMGDPGARAA